MKKLILTGAILCFGSIAWADHDSVAAKDCGTYFETFEVLASSIAGTQALAANSNRVCLEMRAIDAGAVYIGTNATTQHNAVAGNILTGLPFYSTSPYKMDGKFTGAAYVTAERGITSIRVRIIQWLNR